MQETQLQDSIVERIDLGFMPLGIPKSIINPILETTVRCTICNKASSQHEEICSECCGKLKECGIN